MLYNGSKHYPQLSGCDGHLLEHDLQVTGQGLIGAEANSGKWALAYWL